MKQEQAAEILGSAAGTLRNYRSTADSTRLLFAQADLLCELRGLERRRGTGGRDRVDHGPRGSDDRANACAGAWWLAAGIKALDITPEYFVRVDVEHAREPLEQHLREREERVTAFSRLRS